jgi:hypothetical protein
MKSPRKAVAVEYVPIKPQNGAQWLDLDIKKDKRQKLSTTRNASRNTALRNELDSPTPKAIL